MKIYKTKKGIVIFLKGKYYSTLESWDDFINRKGLHHSILSDLKDCQEGHEFKAWIDEELMPPIGSQELWAAGVTYYRSKEARMDESKNSGGATFYDKVYNAERPELFFKSQPYRVAGHNEKVNIRRDSTWNVPEPELTLFISSMETIEGYTIGNDMSSRSIEGENPLYLPQAKTYEKSASLGPCLHVPAVPMSSQTTISLEIVRKNAIIYEDSAPISQMKRSHQELAHFLYRECIFPKGCFLMTGTCLVPGGDFTLQLEDEVNITIEEIGTLRNIVGQLDR